KTLHSFKWIATAERIEAQINPHSMKKQIYALGGGLTFLFVLAAIVAGLAQTTRVVTGVVSDGQGDPLPGVTVLLKDTGSQGGTTTDASGRFSLSVPEDGGTLIFSFSPAGLDRVKLFAANMEGVAYIERYAFELIESLSGEKVGTIY